MDAFSLYAAFILSLAGHQDFNVRESIFIPLPVAVIGLNHPDPEVRQRCERRLETNRVDSIRALVDANQPLPWIDALPPDHPDRCDILNGYLTASREFYYADQADWPHWRKATELYLYSLPYEQAKELLGKMPRGAWWNASENGWKMVTPKVWNAPSP